ncbi:uncharacterized protein OCT59_007305 [Rhizophagus irregularis]|uniref:Uncharacterized protein n=2 Tax=Rhizophagus irregularis TaxID=588596 RepID=A0A015KJM9_RHIIW|nr:hypothetical protein RirG_185060 [Rhizophagus irregularis DAOM 197198w]UZO15895.1 hypothetical protein OCT59_007305 [Rhizophagus irregularis]
MPVSSIPLVTLLSELANSEKPTWLFSSLWCFLQIVNPFHQFVFTWMDLKRMNLIPKTGKIPSWFTRLTSIPNLIHYLPAVDVPLVYPPHFLNLQDSALATIDEHSRLKARNRYYWIAGLDASNSLIFGCIFYTVDMHKTRIVYFTHWTTSSSN